MKFTLRWRRWLLLFALPSAATAVTKAADMRAVWSFVIISLLYWRQLRWCCSSFGQLQANRGATCFCTLRRCVVCALLNLIVEELLSAEEFWIWTRTPFCIRRKNPVWIFGLHMYSDTLHHAITPHRPHTYIIMVPFLFEHRVTRGLICLSYITIYKVVACLHSG